MTGTVVPPVAPQAIPADIVSQIRGIVTQEFTAAIAPLEARNVELTAKLDALAAPQSQSGRKPSAIFGGGAPAIRQGEDPLSSRGYSFGRLFQAIQSRNFGDAKVEQGVHEKLLTIYGGHVGKDGVLAPLGGEHLYSQDPAVAAECAELVKQGVGPAVDRDEIAHAVRQALRAAGVRRQDLGTTDDLTGGLLLGPTEQGEMIDLLRARELFPRAGAREVTLPPNGRLQFPKHAGTGAAYWVGEAQPITASDESFGVGVTLQAKKVAALTTLPNDMLRFVSMNIELFIRTEIAKTLSLKVDSTLLNNVGAGGLSPKGLLQYSGILTYLASTIGASGNTFEPQDVAKMIAAMEEEDVDVSNFTFAMRPAMWAAITTRRNDAVTAADGKGAFSFRTASGPDSLDGNRVVRTTQVPNDRVKTATDLSLVLGGDFSEYLIGRVGVMEFAMDPYSGPGGTNFKNDMTSIRATMHMDGAPRRESAFILCDTLIVA